MKATECRVWGGSVERNCEPIDKNRIEGVAEHVATRVAGNSRCWWRNSNGEIKRVLTIAYFDKLGVPRLS